MDKTTYGKGDVGEALFEIANRHPSKRRIIGSIISKSQTDFKETADCVLSERLRNRFFLFLKAHYKHRVFGDIKVLTHDEKRWLYNHIIIKWREYRDKLKE